MLDSIKSRYDFNKVKRRGRHCFYWLIFISLFLTQACSPEPRPTFEEVVENFKNHKDSFNSVKMLACKIAPTYRNKLNSDTDNIENAELAKALEDIGVSSITASLKDGDCGIALTYYAIVLGGNGISYSYTRNLKIGIPYDPKVHKLENMRSSNNDDVQFYMQLEDGWYFVFKYT